MKKLLLSAAILGLISSTNAASVAGDVKFSVDIPEIIVLYHWNTARLNLTANSGFHDPNGEVTGTVAMATGPYNVSGSLTTTDPLSNVGTNGKIKVKLVNSWAVRSIAQYNPRLTLTESASGSYTLKNNTDDTKTLTISNAGLRCAVASTATGASCPAAADAAPAIPPSSVRLAPGWTPKTGNIEFELDLSNLEKAGVYSSDGSDANTFNLQFETQTSN